MRIFLILIVSSLSLSVLSQTSKDSKAKFVDAEYYFLNEDYEKALPLYIELSEQDTSNYNFLYRVGLCYLNIPFQAFKSIKYLDIASKHTTKKYKEGAWSERNANVEAYYFLGYAYQLHFLFDEAIAAYTAYKNKLDVEDVQYIDQADIDIKKCKRAKELMQYRADVQIVNIGRNINTKRSEYNPCVSDNDSVMVFVRLEKIESRKANYNGEKKEAIYDQFRVIQAKVEDGAWIEQRDITRDLSFNAYFVPVSLSANGKTLFLYRDNYTYGGVIDNDRGTLYVSTYDDVDSVWSSAEKLNNNVNTLAWETHASLSNNGKTLYFTSDRDGGIGGVDIYVSQKDILGSWGSAENLGTSINTPYDEGSPFIIGDSLLYFSSFGHDNIGNSDVFMSKRLPSGEWSTPVNLGIPINSPADDEFFVPVQGGACTYYAIERNEGYLTFGEKDIYKIQLRDKEDIETDSVLAVIDSPLVVDSLLSTTPPYLVSEQISIPLVTNNSVAYLDTIAPIAKNDSIIISGLLKWQDNNELAPVVSIYLVNSASKKTIATIEPNYETGTYSFKVAPGEYSIKIESKQFEKIDEYVYVSKEQQGNILIENNLVPKSVASGDYVVIKALFFDFNSFALTHTAKLDIERLYNLMSSNSRLLVEISGHTDAKGSAEYNKKLSQKRTKSVVDYLIVRGVSRDRFVTKYMGADSAIAINVNPDGTDNPEGRKLNRRVEIKLLTGYDSANVTVEPIQVPQNLRKTDNSNYTILVLESTEPMSDILKTAYNSNNLPALQEVQADGRYFYYISQFSKKQDVLANLNAIIDIGFAEAELIAEPSLNQKLNKTTNKFVVYNSGTKFTIQIGAYRNFHETSELFPKLTDVRMEKKNNIHFYFYGTFNNLIDARAALKVVQEKGYNDAFVVNIK